MQISTKKGTTPLEEQPKPLRSPSITDIHKYNRYRIKDIREFAGAVETAWREMQTAKSYWSGFNIINIDKFIVDEISNLTMVASNTIRAKAAAVRELTSTIKVSARLTPLELEMLNKVLKLVLQEEFNIDKVLIESLSSQSSIDLALSFLKECEQSRKQQQQLSAILHQMPNSDENYSLKLRSIHEICVNHNINTLNISSLRSDLKQAEERCGYLKRIRDSVKPFVEIMPESASWPISSLQKAAGVIESTPRKVLSNRSQASADPTAEIIIQNGCTLAKTLKERRERLEANVSIVRSIATVDQLISHANAIKCAGLFSIFNKEYRLAKKTYMAITRRDSFKNETALEELNTLIDWKNDENKLFGNSQLLSIVGTDFGLDSDLDLFDSLLSYYRQVEIDFPGIANQSIRQFLKTGSLDLLQSLPKIDEKEVNGTFAVTTTEIQNLESRIASNQDAINRLISLVSVLREPSTVAIETLPQFAELLDAYLQTANNLDNDQAVSSILKNHFNGHATYSETLDKNIEIAKQIMALNNNAQTALSIIKDSTVREVIEKIDKFLNLSTEAKSILNDLCKRTGVDFAQLAELDTDDNYADYIEEAAKDKDGMNSHSRYETTMTRLKENDLDWVVIALLQDGRTLDNLGRIVEAVIFRTLAAHVYNSHRDILATFPGRRLNEYRKRLGNLDREIIEIARSYLRAKLYKEANPPGGIGVGRKSEWTHMSLIHNELEKKRGFISVRDLTHRAGEALLELKPCWMMSPLAVAQYLRKGDITFDLLIIDEASQMTPENALGALIRTKQAMVVGDTNQLPPTPFFHTIFNDEDSDEDETVLEESILEMANAAFRPNRRRLRWHYRSRHSALINFSNHMVYQNDLVVFPAASEKRPNMGVSLVPVKGRYKSGINAEEAEKMVDAALQFMKTNPNRSLGLVTLNNKQQELIDELMQFAIKKDSVAAKYIDSWQEKNDGLESFFTKNLENVQGDERDVIFIGTVYGPEEIGGKVANRFGPINGSAGKRRLNVLFSRAREQIVTFSSMTSDDIRADENSNSGLYMLKRWLEYSIRGYIHTGVKSYRPSDSDFEDFVAEQIRSMGCEAIPQVGAAGYFIDIGIKHVDWPYGYIMGVECDGVTYHSSKSARDRDRLREEVLKDLGWHLHRIWSTDWFSDPRNEIEILREAIVARLKLLKEESASYSQLNVPIKGPSADEDDLEDGDDDENHIDEMFEETASGDDNKNNEGGRRLEEVSQSEIAESIIEVLQSCPNYSCTLNSLTKRVLKNLGIRTRSKPRLQFRRRVLHAVRNLVYNEQIEKYRAKNERVRLLK